MTSERRRAGWTLLVAGAAGAFALALVPGLAALVPVEAAVDRLGNDYFLLGVFGGVAVAVLGWMVARRASERVDQAAPPAPETVPSAPRPGARFDSRLARRPGGLDAAEREQLVERLRSDAVAQQLRAGADRAGARRAVESGEWTDDPAAARLLRPDASPPPVTERLRLALSGDSWTQHGARAAARELVERGTDQ